MQPSEATSDYTAVASWYDSTRDMPPLLLHECFRRVEAATEMRPPASLLDAGCGTSQLSIPLLERGYRVVGLDVSQAMVEIARSKMRPEWDSSFIVGDVRHMQFDDDQFDATVVSKLFQHVGNWRLAVDGIWRVTRSGGYLLHINEKGAFKHAVRRQFAAECDRLGFVDRYPGFRDRSMLAEYLVAKGAKVVNIDVADLRWTKSITYAEAIEHLRLRLHSEFWSLPDSLYLSILESVTVWAESGPQGLETVEQMEPYFTAEVFEIQK